MKRKEKIGQKLTNDPRNNCGTHLGSRPLLLSKAANSHANYKHLRRTIRVISPENLFIMLHSLNRGFAVRNPYVQKSYLSIARIIHPSPSTTTCTPNKHIERTLISVDYS